MTNAKSEKVQMDAAKILMKHLEPPASCKSQIDPDAEDRSGMTALKETIKHLAAWQLALDGQGVPTREITCPELYTRPNRPPS